MQAEGQLMWQSSERGPKKGLLSSGLACLLSCLWDMFFLALQLGVGVRWMEVARLKKINPWRGSVLFNLLFKQPKASRCGVYIFSGWKAHEDSQIYSTQESGFPRC